MWHNLRCELIQVGVFGRVFGVGVGWVCVAGVGVGEVYSVGDGSGKRLCGHVSVLHFGL